jgi:aminopeptidase-like protein
LSDADVGNKMYGLIKELYPICRSITGDGVRQTLDRIGRIVPLEVHEVPTGTEVFDWTVPREWNIDEAFIEDENGNRLIDFRDHSLHVVSYSVPVDGVYEWDELEPHLHTLPEHPDWIPYRTSYYKENWGFCLAHRDLDRFKAGPFRVVIRSSLTDGNLTYGETMIPGATAREVLFFNHVCHPSLCNDNLSGNVVMAELAHRLRGRQSKFTYRFVWAPGTIGSITWLSRNHASVQRMHAGLVGVLLGDAGPFHYKRTRRGAAEIDRVAEFVLAERQPDAKLLEFSPYGYDERQFGSPGIDAPVGRLTRTPNGAYEEYHSSADNLDFVRPEYLAESLGVLERIVEVLEGNASYRNTQPRCEPQLGKRGLYGSTGGSQPKQREHAILWVLSMSDTKNSLLDISTRSGIDFDVVRLAANDLLAAGLLEQWARTETANDSEH